MIFENLGIILKSSLYCILYLIGVCFFIIEDDFFFLVQLFEDIFNFVSDFGFV
jgi:hypothetical protein